MNVGELPGAGGLQPAVTLAGREQVDIHTPRVATAAQATTVAGLLDAFNREFDTPTPGRDVLAARLGQLLAWARRRPSLPRIPSRCSRSRISRDTQQFPSNCRTPPRRCCAK